jgi:lactoylglutathione lyase
MFDRVCAVALFVQDFDKCLAFYRDTLGLQVIHSAPKIVAFKMQDQDFALYEMSEAAELINVEMGAFEPQTGKIDRVMLCALVDNVDTAYEAFKAKGVEFTKPPIDQPWGIRAAYFRDPEGNVWEIAHKLTPA